MKALFRHGIGVVALMLMVGCIGITPLQREAGERMARRMATRYDTPLHEPFFLPGGSNAALFIHGFPGSPAQVRPLAEALHARGWTVRGILMPGGGKDVDRLSSLTGDEWTNAIRTAVSEMSPHYKRLVIVAYSMGSAMTCASVDPNQIDGLVLIGPYQWQESATDLFVWTFLHPFMPKMWQPFSNSNLSDPATKAFLGKYFPQEFLESPDFQNEIRSFTLPIPLIAQLRTIVRSAYGRKWEGGRVPTLILQGTEDTVAYPARSRELALRWGGLTRYEELAGDHSVVQTSSPAFSKVVHSVCAFAAEVAAAPPIRDRTRSRPKCSASQHPPSQGQ